MRPFESPLYHRLNVIDVAGDNPRMLLVRLDHPCTSRTMTAAARLEMEEFQQVVKGSDFRAGRRG